jgi:hypothetical protein
MLRILGSPVNLGERRPSRRDLLRAGGLAAAGWAGVGVHSPAVRAKAAQHAGPHLGRAKRVILLYLYGAAAQHELWDLKPEAPAKIRGEFGPIATSVPGLQLCEHLPRLARIAERCCFIRSMTHPYNIHSAAYTLTGVDRVDIPMELGPYDPRHWPFFGSVLEYLQQRRDGGGPAQGVPFDVALPFPFSSRAPEFQRGGPYGGFLGRGLNPVWTEFAGEAAQTIDRWRGERDVPVPDPFAGIRPGGRLTLASGAELPTGITLDRLDRRRSLVEQFERGRRALNETLSARNLTRAQDQAYALIGSAAVQQALDLEREPPERRERYGMTLFGQATLAGRRLLEAGATVVSVFWDEYETANSAWDTHFSHFERLRDELLPGLDRALSALLVDLEERGLLADTLVMCLTEHGRTPRLSNTVRGAGREHWSTAYCNLLAGAGIAQGKVVGRTDKFGGYVDEEPISPKDVLCTLYHLMGVDPESTIPGPADRPLRLVAEGEVKRVLLA